ncbi:MAG TPA: protein kinase [Candidatus Acidoferrales bacterium]|nr:protein kinase [Candidatus Acidoferrales bacterium]
MANPGISIHDLAGSRVDRFLIKTQLGRGGMGEVFLGEDTLLKRDVAIKVIRREYSQDPIFRERLLKEAQRASQLNDEHIARIYDVLVQDQGVFVVMEYVQGQTLRQRIGRHLSVKEFFSIAGQCLSGLAAAHEKGILHCDLKPDNLMITPSGTVKILDFGFARKLETPDSSTTLSAVTSGGTPGYVAPEVLLGCSPDQRADIFSLGVLLHEALTGEHPFRRGLNTGRIHRALPAGLDVLVGRMLASDPEQRYKTCTEALTDLNAIRVGRVPATAPARSSKRWSLRDMIPAMTVLILAAILVAVFAWRISIGRSSEPAETASRQLVVLPFLPSDASDASSRAFANGLTDTLSAKLGEISDRYQLQVVPGFEVRAQKVSDARRARTMLGATMVLNGSLQRSGGTIRVIYTLVDTRSLHQTHSGVITADASNPFSFQDRVISEVLSSLDIELGKDDRDRMASHETTNSAAYDHYLRGRGYLQGYDRKENLRNAIAEFQESVDNDSSFGLAHAGLGQAYILTYVLEHRPELVSKANEACARAAQLGGRNPGAHLCMGMLFNATGKYEQAARHLESSLKLDNDCDECYRQLSMAYEQLNRPADAESILKRDIALHPQQWPGYKRLGSFYASLGRYDEAVSAFKQVVKLAPDSISGYSNLGAVYVVQGNYSDASEALEKSIAIQPTAAALSNLGAAYFYLRKYQDAARTYAQAAELSPNEYEIFGNLAEAYAQIEGSQNESRRNYARALDLAEERLKVNPRDGAVRMDAALYSAMLGEREKALQYRKAGLKLSAENPQTWHRSALALAQLHEDGQALVDLQRALRAGLSASEISNNPAWQRFSAYPEYRRMVRQTQSK